MEQGDSRAENRRAPDARLPWTTVFVRALDATTGNQLWISTVEASHAFNTMMPRITIDSGRAFLGCSYGRLRLDGFQPVYDLWAFELD